MELHKKISNDLHVIIISEGEFRTIIFGLNAIIHGYGDAEPEKGNAKILRAHLAHLKNE